MIVAKAVVSTGILVCATTPIEVAIVQRDPDDLASADWLEAIEAQGDFIDQLMEEGDGLGA